ncbi:hypothetical protein HanXRQr2_Chr01g0044901 [Helianthus annuus]|uniref:Uncharacterized protein n=1 Tax=Helianthus annuus TaxID=4232 RepID=A0A9K3JYF5_HELAN|nr:hypothetical protein HanXRQr2_Chr01g0044901 [Helianthus annuus]KAJ0958958.1 hypothetical protein HanPSC8_Chr01g0044631 [Helianthus annuus]
MVRNIPIQNTQVLRLCKKLKRFQRIISRKRERSILKIRLTSGGNIVRLLTRDSHLVQTRYS